MKGPQSDVVISRKLNYRDKTCRTINISKCSYSTSSEAVIKPEDVIRSGSYIIITTDRHFGFTILKVHHTKKVLKFG